jgi:CBS domain-containing protein
MQTEIVTAAPDEPVARVAQRMRDRAVGAVLVVQADALQGIFSERDLLNRVVAAGKDTAGTLIGDVCTREVATVDADTSIQRCAEILREKRCRHLPVLDGGRPVGIISARDFFAHMVDSLEQLIEQHRYQEQLDEGVDPYEHAGGSYER